MRTPHGHPDIPSLPNLRDLGGYRTRDGGQVRRGLLYRSVDLGRLHGDDAAAFGRLGVRTVFDLRTEVERSARPDLLPPGTGYVIADVLRDSFNPTPDQLANLLADPAAARQAFGDGKAAAFFVQAYREFVSLGSARTAYGRLFSDLTQDEHRPALFHCSTGKDRTGWAAAALLLLVGVPDAIVMEDFLLSNERLRPMVAPLLDRFRERGGDPDLLLPLMGVQREYLQSALDEMRRSFGTVERYFADGLGVDAAAQDELQTAFVERG